MATEGVEINVGTQHSNLSDSEIAIGDLSRSRNERPRRTDDLFDELDELLVRLIEMERVLGGQWGMPGLVQQVAFIKDTVHTIKLDLKDARNKDRLWATLYLVTATGALIVSLGLTIAGLWR